MKPTLKWHYKSDGITHVGEAPMWVAFLVWLVVIATLVVPYGLGWLAIFRWVF